MRDASYLTASTPVVKPRRRLWATYFLDVSNNNGPSLDFRTIAQHARRSGITAVGMKATEGTTFTDPNFAGWREQAEHFGLRVFAYHFARPDQHDAASEAAHFCRAVGKVRPGEWRPMLDFETAPFRATWAHQWNLEVRKRLGVAPTFYSYTAAIEGMRLAKPIGAGLVLAYPNGLPRVAPCPKPWNRWTAHQYSWHGVVAGVPGEVDLNWTPSVWSMLAYPVRGAALEPMYAARRRRA